MEVALKLHFGSSKLKTVQFCVGASNTTFLPERKNENWGYQCCFCDCFSCFQSGMSLQGAKMQFFFLMENE